MTCSICTDCISNTFFLCQSHLQKTPYSCSRISRTLLFLFFDVLSLNCLCHRQALHSVENGRPVTFLATRGASVSQAAEKWILCHALTIKQALVCCDLLYRCQCFMPVMEGMPGGALWCVSSCPAVIWPVILLMSALSFCSCLLMAQPIKL